MLLRCVPSISYTCDVDRLHYCVRRLCGVSLSVTAWEVRACNIGTRFSFPTDFSSNSHFVHMRCRDRLGMDLERMSVGPLSFRPNKDHNKKSAYFAILARGTGSSALLYQVFMAVSLAVPTRNASISLNPPLSLLKSHRCPLVQAMCVSSAVSAWAAE